MTRLQSPPATPREHRARPERPRLGFAGVGWIGRHRMQSIVESGLGDVAAVTDPCADAARAAAALAPGATECESFEDLLNQDLDAVVIATPSALHARQSIAALERGLAVFCQKPLARTARETREVVAAARAADRRLGVDLSYRHVNGVARMRELIASGELGNVYSADLTFHNAYGPDKAWFYDPRLSGGGCVIDLGTHLVDLALWMLDFRDVVDVRSRLYAAGQPLRGPETQVEDGAWAEWVFDGGASVRLACSWRLPAGQDAVIEATFYGTRGAVSLRNVNGSFYDFVVDHLVGTGRTRLAEPPDTWGGRAIVEWAARLQRNPRFDCQAEEYVKTAAILDAIYGR